MRSSNDLHFRKSSYSGRGDNCVEVANLPAGAAVRDTQNRDLGHLSFAGAAWTAALSTIRTDQV
ncbi:hypothetical protein GCM10007079_49510 [Nocardiopsis terrae]|uniref:DUF397 domain-containing protein n=1 Tax=Nocardiopsis terrae TaxID=372655 RepID=A0ABR9HA62_9ACTN|nr:DUF397 domain-containing protein [Nocardiopsis terrae]MBE1455931.1 hypothetical protein [Nocardiopsis terrae]GHC96636.1 hypothetical protein GCM10007079_49510 [Nocardiopsis terrae]